MKASLTRSAIVVSDLSPQDHAALHKIPGHKWDRQSKSYSFPISFAIIQAIHNLATEMSDLFDGIWFDSSLAYNYKELDTSLLPNVPNEVLPSWEHQKRAYHFIRLMPSVLLAMDMGTGKSKVIVDYICNERPTVTLIACPTSVVGVWEKQFRIHGYGELNIVPLLRGSVKKRQVTAAWNVERFSHLPTILIINYEAVHLSPMADWLKTVDIDMMILDESHRIKSPNGKVSKFISQLARDIPKRIGLTGTPMPHSPLDIYAQYRALDPGVYGYSVTNYKARYCLMGGYEVEFKGKMIKTQILKWINTDELYQKYDSISYSVKAKDVLDLPEVMHEERLITLNKKAQKIYDSLEKHLYAEIDSGEVTAANAMVKTIKLRQVMSGYVKPDGSDEIEIIDNSKATMLKDLLKDIPGPVVVFCIFIQDLSVIRSIAEALKLKYGEVSGRCKDLIDGSIPDGIDVLGVQIQAGGVGVDFTKARYGIYYSIGYSLGDYQQSLARIHRPGQKHNVVYYHILADNTIDRKIYLALEKREDVIKFILEDRK